MSEISKITDRHWQRRAVVYVRQSTPGQVERNTESAARQYALAERAVELGWPAASVLSCISRCRSGLSVTRTARSVSRWMNRFAVRSGACMSCGIASAPVGRSCRS